jgi:predicted nucleic acid-binding protein
MILCDAAPLFCSVDKSQPRHLAVKTFLKNNPSPLITTWACFTEAMYLSLQRGGWLMQNQLGKLLLNNLINLNSIKTSDYSRLFKLMEKYQDRPMDLADATLVVTAESLKIRKILTFDSDFFFYLINDKEPFDVINIF